MIFDLWQTLADWPGGNTQELLDAAGLDEERWRATAALRWTLPLRDYFRSVGVEPVAAERACELRTEMTRRALVPCPRAIETLAELRRRGHRLGLVSNCSGEVAELWPETSFAPCFDAAVFSTSFGVCKPDRRIYLHALEQLGVGAGETLFVGDGDGDELAGAARVGMRAALLIHSAPPVWEGLRITSIAEVLELC